MADTLDSVLEATLANSSIACAQDALLAAVHSTLLTAGYSLVALGDQVTFILHVNKTFFCSRPLTV